MNHHARLMKVLVWLMGLLVCLAVPAMAMAATTGPCVKQGTVCIEGPETRNVNGNDVYRDCWRYRDTYQCGDGQPQDYCKPIAEQPDCYQVSTHCIEPNPDGSCKTARKVYQCSHNISPQPNNTVVLDSSYTASDTLDTSQCQNYTQNQACSLASSTCTQGPETRTIDGQQVYRDCWQYKYDYTCTVASQGDYCAPLRTAGCTEIGQPKCTVYSPGNTCIAYTHDYVCSSSQSEPPPPNIQFIDGKATITSDTTDNAQCSALASDPSCQYVGNACTGQGSGACYYYVRNGSGNWVCSKYTSGPTSVPPQERNSPTVLTYDLSSYIETKPNACLSFGTSGVINREDGSTTLNSFQCFSQIQPAGNANGIYYYDGNCQQYRATYACPAKQQTNTCGALANDPKCKLISRGCEANGTFSDGTRCIDTKTQYECVTRDEERVDRQVCDQVSCVGGICQDPPPPPNADFGQTVASLEIARQAAAYQDPNTFKIFGGKNDKCSVKGFGIGNCCKADVSAGGAASTNSAIALSTGLEVGREVLEVGSEYVYDMLAGNSLQTSFAPVVNFFNRGGEGLTTFDPQISAYGFSIGVNTMPSNSGLLGDVSIIKDLPGGSVLTDIPGLTTASSLSQNVILEIPGIFGGDPTTIFVAFDPATLAWQIAFQIVMNYLSCDPSEVILAKKRGQGLCFSLGQYCSSKFLGACVTRKESFCCFNSKLARIINQQGAPQIGKSFGTPKDGKCDGFTPEELEQVDFSRIDLSEFIADIKAKAQDAIQQNGGARLTNSLTQRVQQYFNQDDYTYQGPTANGVGNMTNPENVPGGNPGEAGHGNINSLQRK